MNAFPKELTHPMGSPLVLDEARVLIGIKPALDRKKLAATLAKTGLELEGGEGRAEEDSRSFEVVNHTDSRFWLHSTDGGPITAERMDALERALRARKVEITWVGPAYRSPNAVDRSAVFCPLPHVLVVRAAHALDDGKAEPNGKLAELLARHGFKENARKSEHLGPYRYFEADHAERPAYELRPMLAEEARDIVADVRLEHMPMVVPTTMLSNDTLLGQQWDMTQIHAAGAGQSGWDIQAGTAGEVICILDQGCDLSHPDLAFASNGINLGTMSGTGAPTGNHGTACAGIAAGTFDNALGVAGVAGRCHILPVAFQNWTDVEVANGINWAVAHGAGVISMSFGEYASGEAFGPQGWDFTLIDPAISAAVAGGCVLCAATGNENTSLYNRYPARNPLVIACGASDQVDNRKSPTSPDGETWWGANWGPDVTVVAPGVRIPTTDRQGTAGYNPSAGTAGDYFMTFNGTSSATPHVAGFAALIRSEYPMLTNLQVRSVIERTADKVGSVAYADVPGFPSGVRNQEMGYGRIDVLHGLDLADVMIRDYPADAGAEPSTPPGGDFWDFSDICIRPTDDGVFAPNNPTQSDSVERGQTNYLYIQVTNNGPRDARNVSVDVRITPYVGLQFVYPADWTLIDANHVRPTPIHATFPSIPAGATGMAKFEITSGQTNTLWGWTHSHPWHPCLLAKVNADNDHAFATASFGGNVVVRRNNFAQKNLTVVDAFPGATILFPFIVGNRFDRDEAFELLVERTQMPSLAKLMVATEVRQSVFPQIELPLGGDDRVDSDREALVFLERARIAVGVGGGASGVLTLERGSRFDYPRFMRTGDIDVDGGEIVLRGDRRYLQIDARETRARLFKQPGRYHVMALETHIPENARSGDLLLARVAQRNMQGEVLGGATVAYHVK